MTTNSSTDSATRDGLEEAATSAKVLVRQLNQAAWNSGNADAEDSWKRQERTAAAQDKLLNETLAAVDTLLAASRAEVERLRAELSAMTEHRDRLDALVNSPETRDFLAGVRNEVAHQVERWGTVHDRAKEPADWFWLVGYLGGKALSAHVKGDTEKAMHHCISTSAALANWHAHIAHGSGLMQPGSSDLQQFLRDTFGANFIEYQADRAALSTKKD